MLAEDHTPEDILGALRMGVDHTFTIKVRTLQFAARALSVHERIRIVNDVAADMSVKKPSEQNGLTESCLFAIRTLELATTPEPNSKIAPRLPAALLERMTNDELSALYNAYQAACDILDPAVEELKEDQLHALVEEAKKNHSALIGLQPAHLAMLVRFLLTKEERREVSTSGG